MEAMYGSTPTKGRLLLATPPLEDPNFDRTVIYVLEHHDEGALGLVLNRPSPEELGDALRAWAEMQSDPSLVFVGGPVEPDALIAIARVREPLPPLAEDDDETRPTSRRSAATSPRPTSPPTRSTWSTRSARCGCSAATPDGDRASSTARSRPARGWSSTPSRPTCSPTPPTTSGAVVLRRQPGRLAWLAERPRRPRRQLTAR